MNRYVYCLTACMIPLLGSHVAAAQGQSIDLLLDQTAKSVSGYLEKISDVRCTETVRQMKLDKNGKTEYSEEGTYDYFVLLQADDDELLLDESRIPKREGKQRQNTPMLISNGFSLLYLVFHPYYRNSFHFEPEENGLVDGRLYRRVRFTYVAGHRTPAAVSVRGREYPLGLTGEAWFEPSTGKITRIEATLNADMQDIGLRSLHAEIDFAPVTLPGWPQTYNFPLVATVDVESLRQHWRNIHKFTDYRRFMVETEQTVSDKGLKSNE